MASRSQMRLQQLTGSLSSGESSAATINEDSLQGVMDHVASAIKRITGAANYHAQDAGQFSQGLTGSDGLQLAGDLDVNSSADISGAVFLAAAGVATDIRGTLSVDEAAVFDAGVEVDGLFKADGDVDLGDAVTDSITMTGRLDSDMLPIAGDTHDLGSAALAYAEVHAQNYYGTGSFASAAIADLTANRVVLAGTSGELTDSANITYDASGLIAASAKISDLTSGRVTFAGTSGELEDSGDLTWDGSDLKAASAEIADLTATRVTFAGANGALVDSTNMTFASNALTIGGNAAGTDSINISGDLTAAGDIDARNGVFSGNMTVAGNLDINGTVTSIDTANLSVEDAIIALAYNGSGSAAPAGDRGLIMEIDGENSPVVFWDENESEFAFARTTSSNTDSTIVVAAYSDLKVLDLEAREITLTDDINAVNGVFSGNVSGVDGTFSGDINAAAITGSAGLKIAGDADLNGGLDVSGGAVLDTAAISDLTNGRLVLAGASGELKDDALFTYTASAIKVGANVILDNADSSVEADIIKVVDSDAQLSIDSARYGGSDALLIENADTIAIKAGADFIGFESSAQLELGLDMAAPDEARFLFNDGLTEAFRIDSANSAIMVSAAIPVLFRDSALYIQSSVDGQLDIVADVEVQIAAATIDMNGDAKVSGDLYLDGSNKELRFYEGANYVGFEAPALSADQIWVLPEADASVADSALVSDAAGNLSWKAPAQESSKKYIIEDGAVAANTDLSTTVNLSAITLARAVHVLDVFVNGQLMKPDLTAGAFSTYAGNVASTADFKLDMSTDTASLIKFGFALEADDIVTVIMRA